MTGKKKNKGKPRRGKRHVSAKETPEAMPAPTTQDEGENNLDFGGIPDRDLRKNLGCG